MNHTGPSAKGPEIQRPRIAVYRAWDERLMWSGFRVAGFGHQHLDPKLFQSMSKKSLLWVLGIFVPIVGGFGGVWGLGRTP